MRVSVPKMTKKIHNASGHTKAQLVDTCWVVPPSTACSSRPDIDRNRESSVPFDNFSSLWAKNQQLEKLRAPSAEVALIRFMSIFLLPSLIGLSPRLESQK